LQQRGVVSDRPGGHTRRNELVCLLPCWRVRIAEKKGCLISDPKQRVIRSGCGLGEVLSVAKASAVMSGSFVRYVTRPRLSVRMTAPYLLKSHW
jgi:hypothetical protein